MRVIGYRRVSTEHQAASGYGLDAQRQAIQQRALIHDWKMTWVEDAASGGTTDRPGLAYARALLRDGQADALVVSHLDRLSRSVLDFADILRQARKEGWNLIVLDLNLDLSSPQGEFVAHILAAVAQLERRLISDRIRSALAAASARGVRTGPKPREIPTATLERITTLYDSGRGKNLTAIAAELTRDGFPLPSGVPGHWAPAQVRRVLARARNLEPASADA